ncbi:hypothetical protein ABZS76_33380 [Streptomyces sp. NPDC005562]
MLKFGTGQITVPDDRRQDKPIARTATVLTDDQRAAILDEEEAVETEEA